MQNGIYFNLPEAEYHSLDRLSSSGIRQLLVNPTCYWANFIDPNRNTESAAKNVGKLFHNFFLKTSGYQFEDKKKPNYVAWADVCKAREILDRLPDVAYLFEGGWPEVSILYEIDGVPMKSRIDYLTHSRILDLKTSGRQFNDFNIFCRDLFYSNKVYLQLMLYAQAIEAAQDLPVFGTPEQVTFFKNIDLKLLAAVVVHQKTPLAKVLALNSQKCPDLFKLGQTEIKKAVDLYRDCKSEYGKQFWPTPISPEILLDSDFPQLFYHSLEASNE